MSSKNNCLEKELGEAKLKLLLNELLEKERQVNNSLYAIKLVEKIVFGMVGFILIAVLGAVIGLVIMK